MKSIPRFPQQNPLLTLVFLTHFIGLYLFVKFLNGRNVLAVNVDNNGSIS